MIGGYFDEHPWGTFDAPIIVEDPAFPGMKQWPRHFMHPRRDLPDEELLARKCSRSDAPRSRQARSDKSRVHRKDNDFAVTWAKMYGKGRVFYSTLGHVEANWDKPEFQKMLSKPSSGV